MAYPQTDAPAGPLYGGARHALRHPRGYRALGRWSGRWGGLGQTPSTVTVRGKAVYKTGEKKTVRSVAWSTWCSTCQEQLADPNGVVVKCGETSPRIDSSTGEQRAYCVAYRDTPVNDVRADGSAGWQMYVPDLIQGALGGYVLLNGNTAGLQDGVEVTVEGTWAGTPPNNLCVNCPWPLNMTGIATPGTPVDPGALDQDSPEIVDVRQEVTEGTTDMETPWQPEPPEKEPMPETEYPISGGETPTDYPNGREEDLEAPPAETGKLSTLQTAAIVAAGLFFLPVLTRKRRSSAGGWAGAPARW